MVRQLEGKERKKAEGWLKLLLNGDSRKEFDLIEEASCSTLFALCKYKKILRSRGRGRVSFLEIEKQYNENDLIALHKSMDELFLEYHTESEMINFLELMKITNTSIEQVYNNHENNLEGCLLSTLNM